MLDGREAVPRNRSMKLPRTLLLLLSLAPLSPAGEVFETLKTREGREYFKVEVLSNDEVGVRIRHEAGTARIPYGDLPDAVQSKYQAERKKAAVAKIEATKAEHERIRIEQEKEKQAQLEEKTKKPSNTRPEPKKESGPTEEEIQATTADREIARLEIYIGDMKVKVREAVAESSRLRGLAKAERSKTRSVVTGYRDTGNASFKLVPDKSGWAKADRYEEQASVLERQADRARVMIAEAKAKRDQFLEDSGRSPAEE